MIPDAGYQLRRLKEREEARAIYKSQWGLIAPVSTSMITNGDGGSLLGTRPGVLAGNDLHSFLKEEKGIDIEPGCTCEFMMMQMNRWGIKGCLENQDEIIDSMIAEARRRRVSILLRALEFVSPERANKLARSTARRWLLQSLRKTRRKAHR